MTINHYNKGYNNKNDKKMKIIRKWKAIDYNDKVKDLVW